MEEIVRAVTQVFENGLFVLYVWEPSRSGWINKGTRTIAWPDIPMSSVGWVYQTKGRHSQCWHILERTEVCAMNVTPKPN